MIATHNPTELTAQEAAARLGVATTTVTRMCHSGNLEGACLIEGRWSIPASSLPNANIESLSYSYKQLKSMWGVSIRTLQRLVKSGKLKGTWKLRRSVRIPESTVHSFETEHALN